jgi:phage baseplate assembly protein gpV
VSGVGTLLRGLARDEGARRSFVELAVVTAQFDSGDDAHTVSVRLKDSDLALPRLPVAGWASGVAALPRIDDVVLVVFPRGDLASGIVLATVHSDHRAPPKFKADEIALIWPGDADDHEAEAAQLRLDGTKDARRITLKLGGDTEASLVLDEGKATLSAGQLTLTLDAGSEEATLAAGGTRIALKQDGDLVIEAVGKLTLSASQVEIKGDASVKINGQTVELN